MRKTNNMSRVKHIVSFLMIVMIAFLFRRMIWMVITLFVVSGGSWFLIKKAPGDPFNTEFRALNPAVKAELRRKYRLDKSEFEQYVGWVRDIVVDHEEQDDAGDDRHDRQGGGQEKAALTIHRGISSTKHFSCSRKSRLEPPLGTTRPERWFHPQERAAPKGGPERSLQGLIRVSGQANLSLRSIIRVSG